MSYYPTSYYPSSITTRAEHDWCLEDFINELEAEIVATQTEMGIDVAGASTDLDARLTALEGKAVLDYGEYRYHNITDIFLDDSNPPTELQVTATDVKSVTWYFDASTAEYLHFHWTVPPDWDNTEDVIVSVDFLIYTASAGTSTVFRLYYKVLLPGHHMTSSIEYYDTITEAAGNWTASQRYTDEDLASGPFTIYNYRLFHGANVFCTLYRDAAHASDTFPNPAAIANICIKYKNKNPR